MQNALFIVLSLIWLAVMVWMVSIAPMGNHLVLFAVLFGCGHVLMLAMVRWFPPNMLPRQAFAAIFIIGLLGRLSFLYYPAGNDIFRYVWEGYIQTQGFNPYSYAPNSSLLAELAQGQPPRPIGEPRSQRCQQPVPAADRHCSQPSADCWCT